MKKILFLLAFIALASIGAHAQTQKNYQLTSSSDTVASIDSFTSATTDTFIVHITNIHPNVTFQVNVDKYAGTVGGDIKVYSSIDGGAHYAQVNSTYTVTDADQTYLYNVTGGNLYSYYMLVVNHTGGSAAYDTWLLYR